MAQQLSDYYDGSRLFEGVGEYIGISIDKINFIVAHIVAIALAAVFRTVLHPTKATAASRHVFGLAFGLLIGFFCFGRLAIHLAVLPTSCYIVIRTTNPQIMQRIMLAVSLSYLSLIHIHRQIYDYGSYSLDITGPLMVITQKVTSLAFSIHDGFTKTADQMTPFQKQNAVTKLPTFLEFFGFALQFPTLMAGPAFHYKEYMEFIDGSNLPKLSTSSTSLHNKEIILEPSPVRAVIKKIFISMSCAITFLTFITIFPVSKLKEDEFVENSSLVQKLVYLYICTTPIRFKYYFAWNLADAVCNNAGIGYNGQNPDGSPNWEKFNNVDIWKFEFSTNLRESIEAWNMSTNNWLRFIVYERVKKNSLMLTYTLSALWHGFYPGYYLTFISGALFTKASRALRRTVRNYFLANTETKLFYDVLTMICTRILMGYLVFPFVMLEFWSSIRLYMHMYWCLHAIGLVSIILVPKLIPEPVAGSKSSIAQALSQAGPITNGISSP